MMLYENKVVIGEIKANKYYLATISEVFKDQFFSEAFMQDIEVIGDTTDDKIEIIGPSLNAFKVMIDYITVKVMIDYVNVILLQIFW